EEAALAFTACLERRSGWPHALFGRAQALRKQSKWREARIDYTALRDADPAWSYALAGYCNMQLKDDRAASEDFAASHQRGLKDVWFLLSYARSQVRRQRYSDAIDLCSEVISIAPGNCFALRNRALARVAIVRDDKRLLPNQ